MASHALSSIEPKIDLPIHVAAYIAGLIDADGCVTVASRARSQRPQTKTALPNAMVLVVNGDLGLIRWLKETIGYGCAYETKTRPTRPDQNEAHWNKVHRFQIVSWPALRLLEQTIPHMRIKRPQAELLMGLAIRGRDFPQHATDEQRGHGVWVTGQMRSLNQRGKKAPHQLSMSTVMTA